MDIGSIKTQIILGLNSI